MEAVADPASLPPSLQHRLVGTPEQVAVHSLKGPAQVLVLKKGLA